MPHLTNWFSFLWKSGWLVHSARTAIGAAVSLTVARLLGMPEAYWAAFTTIVVMQSSLGTTWSVSKQRFIGTACGAVLGGLLMSYFEPGIFIYGSAIFVLGLVCAVLHLDLSAYRFAGITVSIVLLLARGQAPQLIAVHRLVEVSVGLAVSLAITALWPSDELTIN